MSDDLRLDRCRLVAALAGRRCSSRSSPGRSGPKRQAALRDATGEIPLKRRRSEAAEPCRPRSRRTPSPAAETTGHEWDGIKELNTPLPKWWLYVLYATIVWSVGLVACSIRAGPGSTATRRPARLRPARRLCASGCAAREPSARPTLERLAARRRSTQIAGDPELMRLRVGRRQGGVRRQLRALPRRGRRRPGRLSHARRRRLAVGRHARRRSTRPSATACAAAIADTRVNEMPAFGARRC